MITSAAFWTVKWKILWNMYRMTRSRDISRRNALEMFFFTGYFQLTAGAEDGIMYAESYAQSGKERKNPMKRNAMEEYP